MRMKSEKKKKKDKHKNKDKEKSKDREERKKHKKDKDRQKDKDRSANEMSFATRHDPIRITIPKDKLNLPSVDQVVYKTGGPMDMVQHADIMSQQPNPSGVKLKIPKERIKMETPEVQHQAALKLKIPKDCIETYNSNQATSAHSSRKKDKNRDREKDKSSKNTASINASNMNKVSL